MKLIGREQQQHSTTDSIKMVMVTTMAAGWSAKKDKRCRWRWFQLMVPINWRMVTKRILSLKEMLQSVKEEANSHRWSCCSPKPKRIRCCCWSWADDIAGWRSRRAGAMLMIARKRAERDGTAGRPRWKEEMLLVEGGANKRWCCSSTRKKWRQGTRGEEEGFAREGPSVSLKRQRIWQIKLHK